MGERRESRTFESGATRDTEEGKFDYEGFFSPLVLRRRAEFMHKHRLQSDGKLRDSDNWQKGMPLEAYMKSGFRHFEDWWLHHRGFGEQAVEPLEEALCALMFNAEGYLHELLKRRLQLRESEPGEIGPSSPSRYGASSAPPCDRCGHPRSDHRYEGACSQRWGALDNDICDCPFYK